MGSPSFAVRDDWRAPARRNASVLLLGSSAAAHPGATDTISAWIDPNWNLVRRRAAR
jgi:hypothetical protein